jgi:hypothetical protein
VSQIGSKPSARADSQTKNRRIDAWTLVHENCVSGPLLGLSAPAVDFCSGRTRKLIQLTLPILMQFTLRLLSATHCRPISCPTVFGGLLCCINVPHQHDTYHTMVSLTVLLGLTKALSQRTPLLAYKALVADSRRISSCLFARHITMRVAMPAVSRGLLTIAVGFQELCQLAHR